MAFKVQLFGFIAVMVCADTDDVTSMLAISLRPTTRHHDTTGEACATCAEWYCQPCNVDAFSGNCWAGHCGDGSGKYCWTADASYDWGDRSASVTDCQTA